MIAGLLATTGQLPPVWSMDALQATLLILVGLLATTVVLCRRPTRQVVFLSAYGVVLSVLFMAVQAPDVALSAMTVGAVALPLLLLLAIAKIERGSK